MIKKNINYSRQSIDTSDIISVVDALKSEALTQGKEVTNFENNLKTFFDAKYVQVVSSGTAALHLTGLALGWKKNDIVITTPLTFVATANSIIYNNATPIFVDIEFDNYQLNLNYLEAKLKKYKKKVKAVIAIDYAGNPCDWKNLRYLANKYSFYLINDNCHSLGSKYENNPYYAAKYSDVVTQSFHPLKNITTGEGGAVITNNPVINNKIKILRNHGLKSKNFKNYWDKSLNEIGYNYRLTDFQSALGSSQLKKVKKNIEKKIIIAKRYNNFFRNKDIIKIPPVRKNCYHSYHLYPILINFKKLKITKIEFMNYFLKHNFRLQVHYKPIHMYEVYRKKFRLKNNDFPNSVEFYNKEVSIPIFPDFKSNIQDKFFDLLEKIIK